MTDDWRAGERKERARVMRTSFFSLCGLIVAATGVVLLLPMKGSMEACAVKAVVKEREGRTRVEREQETVYRFARAGWWMRENKAAALAIMAAIVGLVALVHGTYRQRPGRRKIILTIDAILALTVGYLFVVWLGESLEVSRLCS